MENKIKFEIKEKVLTKVYGVGVNNIKMVNADYKKPTILGRAYYIWKGMLARCYGKQNRYKSYWNCRVCPRWHTFSNFLEDLPKIEGFDKWLNSPKKTMALDKDTKGKYHSYYCIHYCSFISISKNSKECVARIPPSKQAINGLFKSCMSKAIPLLIIDTNTGFIFESRSTAQASRLTGVPLTTLKYGTEKERYCNKNFIFYKKSKEEGVS